MYKRLKKELQINIEDKDGHLFLGEKKKDIRLLMLRPNEILEFAEFAGSNADDILIWVGKTLGKSLMEKYFYEKDWSNENMATKKEESLTTGQWFKEGTGWAEENKLDWYKSSRSFGIRLKNLLPEINYYYNAEIKGGDNRQKILKIRKK